MASRFGKFLKRTGRKAGTALRAIAPVAPVLLGGLGGVGVGLAASAAGGALKGGSRRKKLKAFGKSAAFVGGSAALTAGAGLLAGTGAGSSLLGTLSKVTGIGQTTTEYASTDPNYYSDWDDPSKAQEASGLGSSFDLNRFGGFLDRARKQYTGAAGGEAAGPDPGGALDVLRNLPGFVGGGGGAPFAGGEESAAGSASGGLFGLPPLVVLGGAAVLLLVLARRRK